MLYIPDVLHGFLTPDLSYFAWHRILTRFVLGVVTPSWVQASSLAVAVDLTPPLVSILLLTAWGLKMLAARSRQALWASSPPSLICPLLEENPQFPYGVDPDQQ
jgi:hypothetical protein